MATITNIRIYTQSKAVPNAGYIAIDKVMMEGNTIVAMGGDVRYVLGVVPMENIVVDAPSVPEKCGCNTANANIFATLIKGVDGITPDMSDYYNKGQVDNKLSTKQDVISDIDVIRRNAVKGANAVQPAILADYVSKDDVDAELSETSTNPIQNRALTNTLITLESVLSGLLDQKQPVISDLDAIRDGAAKGATALQSSDVDSEVSETSTNPVQNKAVAGVLIEIVGQLDTALSSVGERFNSKQDKLVSGENIKTINGESIIGEGNIEIEGGSADLSEYATEEYVHNAVEAVNVKGEDGYVYSNGEKVDMRFTRSLIPVGTSIPANANLNTVAYLKVGKYYCSQNADAKTITNCPTTSAFSMEVFNPLSPVVDNETTDPYVYRIRILTVYNTGVQYVQYATVGSTVNKWTYNSWYVIPRSPFTLNSNKKGGSAALGSATQGVYINSEGTFTKMSYTLGKSVPSSAVFTDTNTKVTAVDNHYTPVEDESVVIEAPDGEVVIGLKRDAAGHVVGVMSTPMGSGGSGGGGIAVETDPVFSASPAASITEDDKEAWNNKVPYSAKDFSMVRADGFMTSEGDGFVFPNTPAAQAEQGFVLATLDDIPNAITEADITAMGFTKNTGTYSKPSGGIPQSDLAEEVRASLRNAEAYKGTVTQIKINGNSISPTDGVVDLGDIPTSIPSEVYITDFDALSLLSLAYNDKQSLEVDKQGLKDALAAHKVILVPYEIADNTSFKGYCTLVGYYEDLLYIKIITEYDEIRIETPLYTPYIFREEVTRRNWSDNQDTLKSGENIKTINGESILGEGDMVVGKTTYFSEEDSLELSPNVVWVRRGRVVNSVQITGFASNMKTYEEYAYHFNTGTIADGNAVKLILPAGVKYANKEIFDALESDTHYELSVVRSTGFVKAVLTAFK